MLELLLGIIDFRRRIRPNFLSLFQKMASKQNPDALFFACSDSRVVPNLFASTNPGNLFVVRNVGNMCPPCNENGVSVSDESEIAAIEFGINNLNVRNIIVCGHSECGAMKAMLEGGNTAPHTHHLMRWLRHANVSLQKFKEAKVVNGKYVTKFDKYNSEPLEATFDASLEPHNILSQMNVLQQLEHISRYDLVKEKILKGELLIHGWWFDIANADVYSYSIKQGSFILLDETKAKNVIELITQRDPRFRGLPVAATLDEMEKQAKQQSHPHWIDPYIFSNRKDNNNIPEDKE